MRHAAEHRLLARLEIHDSVPLAVVVIPLVVNLGQAHDAVVCRIALGPISCAPVLGCFLSVAGQLPIEQLIVHLGSCLHGIFE